MPIFAGSVFCETLSAAEGTSLTLHPEFPFDAQPKAYTPPFGRRRGQHARRAAPHRFRRKQGPHCSDFLAIGDRDGQRLQPLPGSAGMAAAWWIAPAGVSAGGAGNR